MIANTINGTPVIVGFYGGITITTPAGAMTSKVMLRSAKHAPKATRLIVEDEVGNGVSSNWADPHTGADLEFTIRGVGIADALASIAFLQQNVLPGVLLTITACPGMPDFANGSPQTPTVAPGVFEVIDSGTTGSNKDARTFTCNLERRPGITQAAPA
jgi:hypothetical protein